MFFLFQGIVMVAFMFVFWHRPAWGLIWLLVPAMAALMMFSAALSVFLAAVNVYLRDTQHLVEVLLMAWFWAIPAVYRFPQTVHNKLEAHRLFGIPGTHLLWVYFANPVTPIVMTFQRFFYAVQTPKGTIAPHAADPGAAQGIHPSLVRVSRPGRSRRLHSAVPHRDGRLRAPRGELRRGALMASSAKASARASAKLGSKVAKRSSLGHDQGNDSFAFADTSTEALDTLTVDRHAGMNLAVEVVDV